MGPVHDRIGADPDAISAGASRFVMAFEIMTRGVHLILQVSFQDPGRDGSVGV